MASPRHSSVVASDLVIRAPLEFKRAMIGACLPRSSLLHCLYGCLSDKMSTLWETADGSALR